MPTPTWLAATAGQATKAGQVNQFLGAHACTYVYAGALQSNQSTPGSGSVASNGQWIAQSFTTSVGQTTIGRVVLTLGVTLAPAPLTVALYASSGGAPTGAALVTTLVPKEFVSGSPAALTIPLPITGLTASTTYHIVTAPVGDASNFYSWAKSNQVTGARTSTNGTTWTTQSYGLLYQVYDGTAVSPLAHTWEDSGARWTSDFYNGLGQLSGLWEYTAGQTATGYLASTRTLSYSSGILTGIA